MSIRSYLHILYEFKILNTYNKILNTYIHIYYINTYICKHIYIHMFDIYMIYDPYMCSICNHI